MEKHKIKPDGKAFHLVSSYIRLLIFVHFITTCKVM